MVENELSRTLLEGGLSEGDSVTVGVKDGRLSFDISKKAIKIPEAETAGSTSGQSR
jgi:hypothetical protein